VFMLTLLYDMNSLSVSDIMKEFISEEEVSQEEEGLVREEFTLEQNSISGKRSLKSEVWDYFDKVEWKKEKRTAKCKVSNCTKTFSCGSEETTRPLWHHLESAHRTRYVLTEEYQRKKRKVQEECGTVEEIFKKVNFLPFFSIFGLI